MEKKKEYTKQDLVKAILNSAGNFFTVTFEKKNGELRELNGRLGVKKHLRGGVLGYNPAEHKLISVFDIQKGAYRMINIDGLKKVSVNKKVYEIKD